MRVRLQNEMTKVSVRKTMFFTQVLVFAKRWLTLLGHGGSLSEGGQWLAYAGKNAFWDWTSVSEYAEDRGACALVYHCWDEWMLWSAGYNVSSILHCLRIGFSDTLHIDIMHLEYNRTLGGSRARLQFGASTPQHHQTIMVRRLNTTTNIF